MQSIVQMIKNTVKYDLRYNIIDKAQYETIDLLLLSEYILHSPIYWYNNLEYSVYIIE